MNIRDLEYFVKVAELRHFKKAADACFVSQPALSMQIKKLEEMWGVCLFERDNKHVLITPVGDVLLKKAKQILQSVQDMKQEAILYQDPYAGNLRLGAFPTLAPYYFPNLVPKINKRFKKLRLLLTEEKTELLLKQLQEGSLDAAYLAVPLPISDDRLEIRELFCEPFYLAVSVTHPLAHLTYVKVSDLDKQSLLLLSEGHCLRDQALEICSKIGASEQQDFRATSLETLRQMVAANVGITLIPKLAIKKDKRIAYIPFKGQIPSRTIALLWRKNSAREELLQQIGSFG